ncbi:pyridoxamine 5'-phosphate oxidase family protein [Cupriavidus pauculus]|uniref:pyridoxamine 5'-phosphate oxidase family protein n=1 Tax=Cupriavidus pauculus TaxID=82633 RepID=UPI001EE2068D|nr:pyridoxamine 5'-phosphate oxidase family protein [Cupriavidus pauculus]GJG94296.1 pyridoxamine 5'-phosphate oxidase family protein [Cupriavidus pauculus]
MRDTSPFHAGERYVQQSAGETSIAERNATLVTDTVIGGARPFIAKQTMVAVASTDPSGRLWSSLLFGEPGFVNTGDGSAIQINVPLAERDEHDPVWANVEQNKDLGMLFIELSTRRRYRVNGTVNRLDDAGADVVIREAYPNCPRYIQRRQLKQVGTVRKSTTVVHGTSLTSAVEGIVRHADTIFVASRHPETGADASHRGGAEGFVHIVDASTLRIPDFNGNSLFNTFGNFAVDPHAGLCILDFSRGQVLQLTGTASVLWDQDDPTNETGGTGRYWQFQIKKWILRETPQPLDWEYFDASPFIPRQG